MAGKIPLHIIGYSHIFTKFQTQNLITDATYLKRDNPGEHLFK